MVGGEDTDAAIAEFGSLHYINEILGAPLLTPLGIDAVDSGVGWYCLREIVGGVASGIVDAKILAKALGADTVDFAARFKFTE